MALDKERNKYNAEIGKLVKKKRLAKGLSTRELAFECDMDKANLIRIERGDVNTSIYILNKVAKALDLSLEELFKGFKV